MTAIGDGMVEGLHADAIALASGKELAPEVQARVIGQIGLAVCKLNDAVISKDDIAELADAAADAAVKRHVDECSQQRAAEPAAGPAAAPVSPKLATARAWVGLITWRVVALAFAPAAPALLRQVAELVAK